MKILFFIGSMIICNLSIAQESTWTYRRVVDGDTIEFNVSTLPEKLTKIKVRIYGIDTPESNATAKCAKEKELGKTVSLFVKKIADKSSSIKVVNIQGWDKYGGRVLADVEFDGKSLRKILLDSKMAREYYGDAKGNFWCN